MTSAVRRAFTLVELLVASAIMVILVLLVVKVANDTMSAYDRVVADLSAQTEARAVLDNLERDLNSAVIRPDGRCWMEIIAPGTTGAPAGYTTAAMRAPNIPADLQPILLFFASPPDRPRFQPDATSTRDASGNRINEIRGDVCAIAYRIGLRSPFDAPGDAVQQVYTVQRTVLDAQSTFTGALTGAVAISATVPPSTFWNGSRSVADYTKAVRENKTLFSTSANNGTGTNTDWTMDEANFCAQNVVALGLTLWCSSSESRVQDDAIYLNRPAYPNGLPPEALRPVLMYSNALASAGDPPLRSGTNATTGSGQAAAYGGFLPSTTVSTPITTPTSGTDRKERYLNRARIYSDRIFLDARTAPLPYTLRQVEVSVTVLTPQGSRELRGLQLATGSATFTESTTSQFRRIVLQQGRPYSRRIQVLGTGG